MQILRLKFCPFILPQPVFFHNNIPTVDLRDLHLIFDKLCFTNLSSATRISLITFWLGSSRTTTKLTPHVRAKTLWMCMLIRSSVLVFTVQLLYLLDFNMNLVEITNRMKLRSMGQLQSLSTDRLGDERAWRYLDGESFLTWVSRQRHPFTISLPCASTEQSSNQFYPFLKKCRQAYGQRTELYLELG